MAKISFFISTKYPDQGPTNHESAQVLDKKFPASKPRVIHALCPKVMGSWNCLHLALFSSSKSQAWNLEQNALLSSSSSPLCYGIALIDSMPGV